MLFRLIMAIFTTLVEEAAMVLLWLYGLPYLGINLPLPLLFVTMVLWGAFSVFYFKLGTRALKKAALAGLPAMSGCTGKVTEPLAPQGMVKIGGELWTAESLEGDLKQDEAVTVIKQEGLKLFVKRCAKH
ncbi:MAG: NfeD family protein [Dehalococcoidales bacterium]|nr:NfeD family protein [Dehalococcoidales bacterium]